MTIKKNVQFLVRTKGITQSDLARKLGMTPENLSHLVNADNIGLRNIEKIAKALKVEPALLLSKPSLSYKNRPTESTTVQTTKTKLQCPFCGGIMTVTADE